MREAWTRVDGRPVRSLTTGIPTDLPEVVVLPGLGAPSYVEPWAEAMGRWTRATVLDLPGWRRGHGRASPSTVVGVARATAGWLRVTGPRPVVLAGHSSGAQAALRVARSAPDRLRGLVLSGPTLEPSARNLVTVVGRFLRTIVHEPPAEIPVVLPWHLRGGPGWFRLVGSVLGDRPGDVIERLALPVLVLTGQQDRFAPPAWAEHLAGLAGGRYRTLPGAHNTPYTSALAAAAAVHDAVRAWAGRAEAGDDSERPGSP